MKTVSVLIPAFNAEQTIASTLVSVLQQTVAPLEIIVLDDGSTDATPRIVAEFGSSVTLERRENRGAGEARNTLCQLAKGELVAFLDSDDVWHPRYLEVQLTCFELNSWLVANFSNHINVVGAAAPMWESTVFDATSEKLKRYDSIGFLKEYNKSPARFGSPSFCCVRRSVLEAMGRFPFGEGIRYGEDYYFMNILASFGGIGFCGRALVAYREMPNSLSSNREKTIAGAIVVLKKVVQHYQNAGRLDMAVIAQKSIAQRHRYFGKYLQSKGRLKEATGQYEEARRQAVDLLGWAKACALLIEVNVMRMFR